MTHFIGANTHKRSRLRQENVCVAVAAMCANAMQAKNERRMRSRKKQLVYSHKNCNWSRATFG